MNNELTMREFGLIGYPLTHSFSPSFFNKKFKDEKINAIYSAFELESVLDFPKLLQSYPNLKGLNVTIPYKQTILPFLDEIDNAASAIGAVNCIAFKEGKRKGFNTDAYGFYESLKPLLKTDHQQALILGTGGSSLAVQYVLRQLKLPFQLVSRTDCNALNYADLTAAIIETHKLIINTTPVGMSPNVDAFPTIPYDTLTEKHLLFDLIYNPIETLFLQKGKERGAIVKNGLEMLHLQAEKSWEIWNSEGL